MCAQDNLRVAQHDSSHDSKTAPPRERPDGRIVDAEVPFPDHLGVISRGPADLAQALPLAVSTDLDASALLARALP